MAPLCNTIADDLSSRVGDGTGSHTSGQIIATSHDLGAQMVV